MRSVFAAAVGSTCLALGPLVGGSGNAPDPYPVHGRCVDADTGAPIAGVTVTLTGHMATGYPIGWGLPEWVDPPPAVTGADGTFRFDLVPPLAWDANGGHPPRFHLDVWAADRSTWYADCTFPGLVELGGADLGDLPMVLGSSPILRVVDESGRPQRDVLVLGKLLGQPEVQVEEPVRKWPVRYQRQRTDPSGGVEWWGAMQPGPWSIEVEGREVLSGPAAVDVPPPSQPAPVLEYVVRSLGDLDTIEGRVVDGDGAPAGETRVEIAENEHEGQAFDVADDGTFQLVRGEQDVDVPVLVRFQRNRRWDRPVEIGTYAWGTRDLVVRVPEAARLGVRVVGASGEPVTSFGVHALPLETVPGLEAVRRSVSSPTGDTELDLRRGPHRLLVVPTSDRYAPSDWVNVPDEAYVSGLRVPLAERIPGRVHVRSGSGEPVSGAWVRLFAVRGPREEDPSEILDSPRLEGRPATWGGSLAAAEDETWFARPRVLLAESTSDAGGFVELRGPADPGPARLIVTASGFRRLAQRVDPWDGSVVEVTLASD